MNTTLGSFENKVACNTGLAEDLSQQSLLRGYWYVPDAECGYRLTVTGLIVSLSASRFSFGSGGQFAGDVRFAQ